ncbi:MAG: restriction endonuclease subunit S [Spiroplasma sp.]
MAIYKLKEVSNYIEGYVNPPINESIFFSRDGIPWIKVSELIHGSYVNSSKFHLSEEGIKLAKNSSQIFKKGTIVWSKSGTIGVTSILNIDAMGNRGILNIKPIPSKILNKYLFYFLCKNKENFAQKGTGAVLKHFYGPNLMNENINLPSLIEQQQIIDIIEPNEKLFLKYSNCVKINNFETVQKDMKNLIDIIEPIENVETKILNIKNKLIKLLVTLYNNSKTKEQISFQSIIKTLSSSYEEQTKYFATNAIGEFEINYEKIIFLSKKIPSRAKISPITNSFIFSKLKGENKLLYFKEKPKEVFSTGFFNFQTNFQDHILGFMLSNDFKNQKEYLSTGTTMQGLNNSSLELIKLNQPKHQSSTIAEILSDLEKNLISIKKLKSKLINLLIK